ncbi:hypothetical protein FISHEDRAFT_55131 [Fistulina hepatica ATCC 64428]|uniref:Uncharacterized protein n=1 Tax=Fistulina hepatica ATCC 64428 TaxID=1128425 RepID=A0A0D7API1_9AGAR|nr:hypothetical protein FISHEDRAFT_55131 [Fistulina hepatica ATCC 64428]
MNFDMPNFFKRESPLSRQPRIRTRKPSCALNDIPEEQEPRASSSSVDSVASTSAFTSPCPKEIKSRRRYASLTPADVHLVSAIISKADDGLTAATPQSPVSAGCLSTPSRSAPSPPTLPAISPDLFRLSFDDVDASLSSLPGSSSSSSPISLSWSSPSARSDGLPGTPTSDEFSLPFPDTLPLVVNKRRVSLSTVDEDDESEWYAQELSKAVILELDEPVRSSRPETMCIPAGRCIKLGPHPSAQLDPCFPSSDMKSYILPSRPPPAVPAKAPPRMSVVPDDHLSIDDLLDDYLLPVDEGDGEEVFLDEIPFVVEVDEEEFDFPVKVPACLPSSPFFFDFEFNFDDSTYHLSKAAHPRSICDIPFSPPVQPPSTVSPPPPTSSNESCCEGESESDDGHEYPALRSRWSASTLASTHSVHAVKGKSRLMKIWHSKRQKTPKQQPPQPSSPTKRVRLAPQVLPYLRRSQAPPTPAEDEVMVIGYYNRSPMSPSTAASTPMTVSSPSSSRHFHSASYSQPSMSKTPPSPSAGLRRSWAPPQAYSRGDVPAGVTNEIGSTVQCQAGGEVEVPHRHLDHERKTCRSHFLGRGATHTLSAGDKREQNKTQATALSPNKSVKMRPVGFLLVSTVGTQGSGPIIRIHTVTQEDEGMAKARGHPTASPSKGLSAVQPRRDKAEGGKVSSKDRKSTFSKEYVEERGHVGGELNGREDDQRGRPDSRRAGSRIVPDES